MPITKSAQKKMRRDKQRALFNLKTRRQMKLAVKKIRQLPTKLALQKASQMLDRAAKKKVIKKNKASRLKSRLAKLLIKKQKPAKKKKEK